MKTEHGRRPEIIIRLLLQPSQNTCLRVTRYGQPAVVLDTECIAVKLRRYAIVDSNDPWMILVYS